MYIRQVIAISEECILKIPYQQNWTNRSAHLHGPHIKTNMIADA